MQVLYPASVLRSASRLFIPNLRVMFLILCLVGEFSAQRFPATLPERGYTMCAASLRVMQSGLLPPDSSSSFATSNNHAKRDAP